MKNINDTYAYMRGRLETLEQMLGFKHDIWENPTKVINYLSFAKKAAEAILKHKRNFK